MLAVENTVIVFALEAQTASRFGALAAGYDVSVSDSVSVVEATHPGDSPVTLRVMMITRNILGWAVDLGRNENLAGAIYLRPLTLPLLDLIEPESHQSLEERNARRRMLSFIDKNLCRCHVLPAEDLYLDVPQSLALVGRALEQASGKTVARTALPNAIDPDYKSAASAFLSYFRCQDFDMLAATPLFAIDNVHKVAASEIGSLVLREGWSAPERTYVWSDGRSSSLSLPIPPGQGPFRVELRGFVVEGNFAVVALVNGNTVGRFSFPAEVSRAVSIDMPITLTADPPITPCRLTMMFEGAVCPAETGKSGDRRLLGFALMSFRIYSVRPTSEPSMRTKRALEALVFSGERVLSLGNPSHGGVDQQDVDRTGLGQLFRSRKPEVCVLLVAAPAYNLGDAVQFCGAQGCQLLILVSSDAEFGCIFNDGPGHPPIVQSGPGLADVLAKLDRLGIVADSIVLWDVMGDHPDVVSVAQLLSKPGAYCGDILMKSDDTLILRHMQRALQDYAALVTATDSAILIMAKGNRLFVKDD